MPSNLGMEIGKDDVGPEIAQLVPQGFFGVDAAPAQRMPARLSSRIAELRVRLDVLDHEDTYCSPVTAGLPHGPSGYREAATGEFRVLDRRAR